jgi:hypothetical protein
MIYLAAGIYAGALIGWVTLRELHQWRERRAHRRRVTRTTEELRAMMRRKDPDAPTMSEERCASLGHAVTSTHRGRKLVKSCHRCGWSERVDLRDFDARR